MNEQEIKLLVLLLNKSVILREEAGTFGREEHVNTMRELRKEFRLSNHQIIDIVEKEDPALAGELAAIEDAQ